MTRCYRWLVKIRRRKYRSGKVGWQLDAGIVDGKRFQRAFETKAEAEKERDRLNAERQRFGDVAAAMTHAQRLRYAEAESKLAAAGVSLELAVEWALAQAPARRAAISVSVLVADFVAEKESKNKRERYLRQLRVSLGSFARGRELTPVIEVTREDVKAWLFGNGWAPGTQRGYLGDLRSMWNWALSEGYAVESPCVDIELAADDEKEVTVFAPEQCEHLFHVALTHRGRKFDRASRTYSEEYLFRPLLGYVALATFVGIRPEEIKRSPRSVLDLEHATALVTGKRAKTRQRRVVDLPPCALAWLRLWLKLCPDQEMIIPRNFRKLWEALREVAGFKPPGWRPRAALRATPAKKLPPPWPQDVLRHTAATMHYAAEQNRARLQAMLGHEKDEDTLDRHYRAVQLADGRTVNKAMAAKFYALFPPKKF